MPRAALSASAVVAAGAQLLDEVGPADFSLAVLAERLGVRPPSLYKHTDGLAGLRRSIMLHSKRDLAGVLVQAAVGRSGDAAVRAVANAYRQWALAHPGQYPATQLPPVAGDADDASASAAIFNVTQGVLSGYELTGDDVAHAIRFLRSSFHGFLALETAGGFQMPVDIDTSYERLVDSIIAALNSWRPAA
ncbi:WHG domain-containing protein [Arthrobacter jiangjiafuii]|uniref:WHG domain-containing protein n=1 Tax=Arthrobacter jiangjiafuii TaxID=2817475 RepID=A0A975M7F5_9MICC|nr:TetR-like C-terminal domain-containing protein [Arthrobacter jiangjiafuii]MBP3044349.1 WHG domain-containing protein [Arthrobacter jiangjiafuii]QWC11302.1 WHG domain-containing protein [Arthrobacter jiangjiafuii]